MFTEFKEKYISKGLFSFYYGDDFIKNPAPDSVERRERKDRISYEKSYLFGNKLQIVETTDVLKDFPVIETRLKIKNQSEENTEKVKDLKTLDIVLETEKDVPSGFPCDNDYAKVIRYRGYAREEEECCPHNDYLSDEKIHSYAPIQARSCDGVMAYFDVVRKDAGAVLSVGWTGQWQADFLRTSAGVSVRVGMQTCSFYLKSGEEYKYVSASLLFYENGYLNGHNVFRKYMKSVSPAGKNKRIEQLPVFTGTWGGFSEDKHLRLIDIFKQAGSECYWMDSGWFGRLTKEQAEKSVAWYEHVGNWNINKTVHPSEFATIKKKCKERGMGLLLWFEFERAMKNSDEYKKHPEWFIDKKGEDNGQVLLNMGIKEARDYFFALLADLIEKTGINWYRQDFNVDALPYMRNDEAGRDGITELAYINGLYEFLDKILTVYPYMMIDNCAGGGNRMDIEMQRRAVTLWRSDYNCYTDYVKEGIQAASMGSALLFPYHGTGVRVSSRDLYDIRAGYAAAADINTTDEDFVKAWEKYGDYDRDDVTVEFARSLTALLKKVIEEYKTVRHLYSENFAPHSAFNSDSFSWCCYEFYNDEKTESVIHVFRRNNSEQSSADYILCGVNENCDYIVRDMDGESVIISGKSLKTKGLHIEINNKSGSKLFYITKK